MSELARRYAVALYEACPDETALRTLFDRLRTPPELWESLTSPAVSPEEKCRVLERCLADETVRPELRRFARLLAEKGRMALLGEIVREFHELDLCRRNAAECTLICVRPPDDASQERIRTLLCRLHHKSEVILNLRTDPALLGGFILEIEGVTYDQSVRGRLRNLARHLEEVGTT